MKIKVKAKPLAGEEKVEKMADGSLVVSVKEPPVNGQANRAIRRVLADYYGIDQMQVRLVLGFSSRQKVFEIS